MPHQTLPPDFIAAKNYAYLPAGMNITNEKLEPESQEYAAMRFTMNGLAIKFRIGKITPKKSGQFVAIWKRNTLGITVPHDIDDELDFFIISTRYNQNFGQFVFPKMALVKHGVLADGKQAGKRGMRIYPPWDVAENPQAQKTKNWQLRYFLPIPHQAPADSAHVMNLFTS